MTPSDLFSLLDQLKVYSNCDELRITYDGNIMSFWFYWMDKEFNVRIEFTEKKIKEFKNTDESISVLMIIVNDSKREWAEKYGLDFGDFSEK